MEPQDYCVIDLEMTGLSASDRIIEVGAVRVRGGEACDTFSSLINPGREIPPQVEALTGISNSMVQNAPPVDEVIPEFLEFIGSDVLVGHNVSFDYRFLKQWAVNHNHPLEPNFLDTLKIARKLLPEEQSKKLGDLCRYFAIGQERKHRAVDDALATACLLECLKQLAVPETDGSIWQPKPIAIRVKKQSPATKHQIQRLQEYMQQHAISDEIAWETLTKSEASRITDKYRAQYGNDG